jgi:DNA-directed RNA polymerase subunit RPC12/RpoP
MSALRTMPWHCIDCKETFEGPQDRTPENGCPKCGSRNLFDCNVDLSKAVPVVICPACRGVQSLQSFVACGNKCVYCGSNEASRAC